MGKDANAIYGINRWGDPYFTVLENGDMAIATPGKPDYPPVSLPAIITNLEDRGIQLPILLRVSSFLENSLRQINENFAKAIADNSYSGSYRGVFPIKVNQQEQVIERIVSFGQQYHFGLECGSKPELIIALSQPLSDQSLIICNGIKDREFVALAMQSRKIGFNTVIVIESPNELDIVVDVARDLNMDPALGVRMKLTHRVGGAWAESSGDRSAFGLTSDQVVDVVDRLRSENLLHTLVLQHSHLGSQIPDLNDVRRAVSEACRYFTELTKEGAPLSYLDLGGGLGFDYTGEKRITDHSVNYTVADYCNAIVEITGYSMDAAGISHPHLVTESGRATVASSSMLLFNVLEATLYDAAERPEVSEDDHHLITELAALGNITKDDRVSHSLHDAVYLRDELRALFRREQIGIRELAKGERVYLNLIATFRDLMKNADPNLQSDAREELNSIADIYHCNFSLFQSLPDVWAIDQMHPITPLQRLNETPDRHAILSDITCDSDGKIDQFVVADGVSPTLPVHKLTDDPYYLGAFYVGAYQETLGDLHNLFGDTNVVTIECTPDGGFELLHEVEGDDIAEVLSYVEYDPNDMFAAFKSRVEAAIKRGDITPSERKAITAAYKDSIRGYTYFEH